MVKRNGSWIFSQHFPWQLPNLNCMSMPLKPRQSECLPAGEIPGTFSENVALQGSAVPGIPSLNVEEAYETPRLLQRLHPPFQTLLPATDLYLKEKQPTFTYGLTGKSTPYATSGSSQRRLLVFDRSGNQTRLIYNSVFPAQHPTTTATELFCGPGLHEEGKAIKIEQFAPTKAILQEFDEHSLNGEETEMHEDTEEINALLYSDETDDYGDSDDEVMSTDHSPLAIKRTYDKQEELQEIVEEVASCDGPHKRHKLLDGGYNKLSLMDTASSVQLKGSDKCDNVVESSYSIGQTQREEMGSMLDNNWSRKDKILNTLRILENIIPDAKEKDPLLVIDEAIDYLKLLKQKAKALGMNYY